MGSLAALLAYVDPLQVGGTGFEEVLIVLIKVLVAFGLLLVSVIFMIWFERKVVSDFQNRIGPNVAGPWGLFQTLADGMKLIFKEDLRPKNASGFVFALAPYLSVVPAFVMFAVVPIGGDFDNRGGKVNWFGNTTYLQVADPPIGILFVLALSSLAVYGIMLAGWASGSKYPLLGSVRASAQMVSYEAALGLSLIAVFLRSDSLSTHDIVLTQADGWGWNLWMTGIVPFIIFLIAVTAEMNRPPFDLVEAEQELVGGFHTEYSSFRFAMFFLAEFMNVITMSGVLVTLFFGGPDGPIPFWEGAGWLWGIMWFTLKVLFFLFFFVWLRATLPRLRYDQLMDLGWKLLIPLSLLWLLGLAALDIASDEGWNIALVAVIVVAVFAVAWSLLRLAVQSGHARRVAGEVID